MFFVILRKKALHRLIREAVDQATQNIREVVDQATKNGFELGKRMGESERTNKGFIIAGRVSQQINDIINRGEA